MKANASMNFDLFVYTKKIGWFDQEFVRFYYLSENIIFYNNNANFDFLLLFFSIKRWIDSEAMKNFYNKMKNFWIQNVSSNKAEMRCFVCCWCSFFSSSSISKKNFSFDVLLLLCSLIFLFLFFTKNSNT